MLTPPWPPSGSPSRATTSSRSCRAASSNASRWRAPWRCSKSVLLADEPTSELDATTREPIVGLLRAEADAGAVVLMATHDAWCADQADAEYHLDEGRLHQVR